MPELSTVVILSTADFDSAVWTNKQHLAVRLAAHTRVIYVESLALRRPRLGRADLARIAARLRRGRAGVEGADRHTEGPSVEVISPVVLPWHGLAVVRGINHLLVWASVTRRIGRLDRPVLWTFSPLTYGIEKRCRAVVYHSVDLIHSQPRMPARTILRAERRLADAADRVIASSSGVRDHLVDVGYRDVLLWENVADTALYARTDAKRRDVAVFAGNLTPSKIDIGLLREVVEAGVHVILAGPLGIDGTTSPPEMELLLRHPQVEWLGVLPPEALAEVVASAKVGLIPYRLNEYTTGVFPLKVYEYLAGGLSVVSTRLPSLEGVDAPGLALADSADFVAACVGGISDFSTNEAATRSEAARSQSWERRTEEALELLAGL